MIQLNSRKAVGNWGLGMKATKAAALTLAVLLCAATPALAQKSKDTLRVPLNDPAAGIDTYLQPSSFSNIYGPSVYDQLLGFDPRKGVFVGQLAKSYTQPDPTTYEFELRTDIKWHDGQSFDADDIVYIIGYLIDPAVKLRYKAYWSWIKSVEKLGATKVRITAKQPSVDGLMYLASRTPVYPEHVHGPLANKLDFGSRPVGTGPVRVVQLSENKGVVSEKYADYVESPVKAASGVGRIVSEPIMDMGTITASLLTGAIDVAIDLPPDQAQALMDSGKFEISLGPRNVGYTFMGFPSKGIDEAPALSDARVRTAIIMAVDRSALLKVKFGERAKGLVLDGALCTKEQIGCGYTKPIPPYDPGGAKKLLAEAGYGNGFDIVISTFPNAAVEATAVAGMLRAIGIRATVRQHPIAQRVQLINQGKVAIGYYGWSGGGMMEVSGQIGRHVDSNEYDDPLLGKFASESATILDDAARRKVVAKIFDRMTEQAYAFPMVPYHTIYTHTKEVKLNARDMRAEHVNPHEFAWE